VRVCFSYTKLNINVLSITFSIIITLLSGLLVNSQERVSINAKIESKLENTNEIIPISEIEENYIHENSNVIDKNIWKIEIPKIELIAGISEGVSKEILDEYVGHFEATSKLNGNIGLAAHNRGYKVNYFERIKELEIGDEVIYTYNGNKKVYVVNNKTIIKDTDWKNLENTEESKITLITCVENMPEYRRCIQCIEI